MIYEHPLAYVLAMEGLALLRAFNGEHDRHFVDERLAEVRKLLDNDALQPEQVARADSIAGYRIWSQTYDAPNSAFDVDEPFLNPILDSLEPGDALDAACGTGRLAANLLARGHRVTGVDSSPEMLALAKAKLPKAEFHQADLTRLPLPDEAVDLVTCSLALTHVPDLAPVIAEFGRVLRPGGHLVISDMHAEGVLRAYNPHVRLPDGSPVRVASHRHLTGDYIRAALAAGLHVVSCEEPRNAPYRDDVPEDPATDPGPWEHWPWSLHALAPKAVRAANAEIPTMVIWQFRKARPA